jgi:hypothetical protein
MARSVSIDSEVVEIDSDDWIDDEHDWSFDQPSLPPEHGGFVVPHEIRCTLRNDGDFPIFDVQLTLDGLSGYREEDGITDNLSFLSMPVLRKGGEETFSHGPFWPESTLFDAVQATVDARVAFTDTWGKRWGRDRHHLIELHPDGGWMPLDLLKSLRPPGGVDADED